VEHSYLFAVGFPSNARRRSEVVKAMLALGALAAVAVGLMLPAPLLRGQADLFLQPGVYSQ
jgi:hypothetical protein